MSGRGGRRLQGKRVVVLGATSGIGLATATRFVAEGAERTFVTGRRQAALDDTAAALGPTATPVRGDLSDPADLDALVAAVRDTVETVDVVVVSAGFVEAARPDDVTPEHYDRTFATNARGTFFAIQALAPLVDDRGSIVLIASAVHQLGVPEYAAYSASKAAMRSFARTWAADLAGRGVRVNAISPGSVDTPAIDAQHAEPDQVRREMARSTPLGRIGRPEEIADAALFLASDESTYITGADLPVDGGTTQL